MKIHPSFAALRLSKLANLALASAALPLLSIQAAQAQDLHPDWTHVWNQDEQPNTPGSMTVPANVVVPVALDNPLSSATARLGDIVTATPISRVDGDSEFPPGTRIGGVVSQVQGADKSAPGVLDVDFQSALLPDGTEVPLHGFIASLDSDAVRTQNGHLIARDGSNVNAWKAVGIGGAAGFVLGRLLKTHSLVPTILGAAGGYLYANSKSHPGDEANISGGTTLGVRLESPVSFPDTGGYASVRLNYLETHRDFSPDGYGWNEAIAVQPRYHYDDYYVARSRPLWVEVSPYDYYGCPLVPIFISYRHYYHRDSCWDARISFWDRPDFHRGPRHISWDNPSSHDWNSHSSNWNDHSSWGNKDNHNGQWNAPRTGSRSDNTWGGTSETWRASGTGSRSDNTWGGNSGKDSRSDNTWGTSGGNSRPDNTGWNRTRVGQPRTDSYRDSSQGNFPSTPTQKTQLPPISIGSDRRSNSDRNWGDSSSRSDNSNGRSRHDSFGSVSRSGGSSSKDGRGGFRGSSRSGSSVGRPGRR
ncbi:hypothetical protein IAD21_06011 [Abditibacteriota bacterium]|nr:hypothetical protein IAD21_06011 [Abditibacteriota bacterium]